MDIIFKDVNGDSSAYQLLNADLNTLMGVPVYVQDYKDTPGHLVKLDFSQLPANDYDPQSEATQIQEQIDFLTTKLVPLQAQAVAVVKLQLS